MAHGLERPDPDVVLARIKAAERPKAGDLRIWLGAAPGSGTTVAMLQEGRRRKSRGTDVVIGLVETHGQTEIDELIGDLPAVPPQQIWNIGTVQREMDTDALIARHPAVALVDNLAHTNATRSVNPKRYQDVLRLLDAGITVITTLNVWNIESLRDSVRQITGLDVQETVPDEIVDRADQIELIDFLPAAIIERMREGRIHAEGQAYRDMENVFTVDNLLALRALALRATAREVEEKLDTALCDPSQDGAAVGERILVAVDHGPIGRTLIQRGWRLAAALKGELIVVHVDQMDIGPSPRLVEEERALEDILQFAEDLGARVERLQGNVSEELITFGRATHVSQVFVGRPKHSGFRELLQGSMYGDLLRKMTDVHIHVIGPAGTGTEDSGTVALNGPKVRSSMGTPHARLAAAKVGKRSGSGALFLYVGAAPGVGKTFAMLQEAHRQKAHGIDVVVGIVETHGRAHTAELIGDLEVIPTLEVRYQGVLLREMDTAAVIARHPKVALIDELAHTNAPGSPYAKRYQDVIALLDHGIDVHSTVNIQHMESLNGVVEQVTGVRVRETVPDWVLDLADQVELIDMAPEALIRRMIHGNIYPPDQAKQALSNFFTVHNLTFLRDLALRATAQEVEAQLTAALVGTGTVNESAPARDPVMVAVDHRPGGKRLIREAWRMSSGLQTELVAVHVESTERHRQVPGSEEDRRLRATLQLADELGARVVHLRGKVAEELVAFARSNGVSQIVMGFSARGLLEKFLHRSVAEEILRELPGTDIQFIPLTDPTPKDS